ncbi:MAG TPA: hypothetical protein VL524_17815 [Gemmatimonadaceae bacterium]|jgi:hypothetical protein|nr:hypothetical protein [Gemmatimonadaceae bacterium]
MSWRLGIAAPMLLGVLGCATARPAAAPVPAASSAVPALSLESIAGDYTLIAIDGHRLPYALTAHGDAARAEAWPVLAGTLALRPNGTFRVETTYNSNMTGGDKSTYQFSGTCFGSEGEFRMVWDGGGQTAIAVRGDTILVKNEGNAFSYLRR